MLLAIDVGNTNTVLGLYRLATSEAPTTLLADWRITTRRDITADEYAILFRALFANCGREVSTTERACCSHQRLHWPRNSASDRSGQRHSK